ncbi:MAG: RraA family protein [Chloroflexi bacterium]|nr:MAG: RraA family protein [Chloroflexota bacterium]
MSPETLQALLRYDSCTLSNAVETFDIRPRSSGYTDHTIRSLFPDLGRVVGYAVTCTVRSREEGSGIDQDAVWRHVLSQPEPRILVAQDIDEGLPGGAMLGEVMGTTFKRLGCAALVTDGTVRDLPEVRAMGLQVFAPGTNPSHAYVRIESVGDEVTVGGLAVRPGDLLYGDLHGVLSIPAEVVDRLATAADAIIEREQKLIGWIRSDDFTVERLEEMRRVRHLASC